jgi:hypothetical protein
MLYVFRAPFHPYPPSRDFLYRIDFQGFATIRWKFHFLIDNLPSGGGAPQVSHRAELELVDPMPNVLLRRRCYG